jgi:hypothetical protein
MKNDRWLLAISFFSLFLILNIVWVVDYLLHNSLYNFSDYPKVQQILSNEGVYTKYVDNGYVFRLFQLLLFSAAIHLFGFEGDKKKPNYTSLLIIIFCTGAMHLFGFIHYWVYDFFILPLVFAICLWTLFKFIVNYFTKPKLKNENILGCNTKEREGFINFKFNVVYKRIKTDE